MSYADWHVGMKVVCTHDDYYPASLGFAPEAGDVCTISWIAAVGDDVVIDLVEFPAPETDELYRGYLATYFRKVQPRKTDISIFEAILHGARVPEDA